MSKWLNFGEQYNKLAEASKESSSRKDFKGKMDVPAPLGEHISEGVETQSPAEVKEYINEPAEDQNEKQVNEDGDSIDAPEETADTSEETKGEDGAFPKKSSGKKLKKKEKQADEEKEPEPTFTIGEDTDFFSDIFDDEEESEFEDDGDESKMIAAETLFTEIYDDQEEDYVRADSARVEEKPAAKADTLPVKEEESAPAEEPREMKYEVVKPRMLGKKKQSDSALKNIGGLFDEKPKKEEEPVAKLNEGEYPQKKAVLFKEASKEVPVMPSQNTPFPGLILREGMQEIKFRVEDYQIEAFVKITKTQK